MVNAATAQSGISLRQLLPDGQFVGPRDVLVRSCCGHWSDCEPNDLFVAIVDSDSDGHDHVERAVAKGACGVVGERLMAVRSPQCIVEDTRQAYGRICHALAGQPATQLTSIGVTGSVGKTVTAHLIHSIFVAAGLFVGIDDLDRFTAVTRFGTSVPTQRAGSGELVGLASPRRPSPRDHRSTQLLARATLLFRLGTRRRRDHEHPPRAFGFSHDDSELSRGQVSNSRLFEADRILRGQRRRPPLCSCWIRSTPPR